MSTFSLGMSCALFTGTYIRFLHPKQPQNCHHNGDTHHVIANRDQGLTDLSHLHLSASVQSLHHNIDLWCMTILSLASHLCLIWRLSLPFLLTILVLLCLCHPSVTEGDFHPPDSQQPLGTAWFMVSQSWDI